MIWPFSITILRRIGKNIAAAAAFADISVKQVMIKHTNIITTNGGKELRPVNWLPINSDRLLTFVAVAKAYTLNEGPLHNSA